MRRLIFVAAASFVLYVLPANAQFGPGGLVNVFDLSQSISVAKQIAQTAEQIGIQSDSLTQLVGLLDTGIKTLTQLQQLYTLTTKVENDVAHLTNANSFATALRDLQNSMPHTAVVPAAITGNGTFGSAADTWAAQFGGYNGVYFPSEHGHHDWVAERMAIDASWLANSQGASAANLDNLETRAGALAELQNCIDNSDTLQDEAACNSRFAAENAYQQNQVAQATNLLILTNGQRDAAAQAQQQYTRQVLDTANDDLCNALGGFGSPNVSTLCIAEGGAGGAPAAVITANNGE